MQAKSFLDQSESSLKKEFKENRSILSYTEYLEEAFKNPRYHLRSAAQYVVDMFDFFGSQTVQSGTLSTKRFQLFNLEFDNKKGIVFGQEDIQQQLYKTIKNFVWLGKIDKLVMLHGPNGSAKSSIIRCIMRGLEEYSQTTQGQVYQFNWIFPTKEQTRGSLGFGQTKSDSVSTGTETYAHLESQDIEAKIPCELRDHPLLLLPKAERKKFFEKIFSSSDLSRDYTIPEYLHEGELSSKNKKIYDALLYSYRGSFLDVLRHIQIERYYYSSRYNKGLAVIEPQMSVDAGMRQLTADRSVASLPKALHNISLFEGSGPLVYANRGVIEFSDLLKRPVEAFKYLLTTCEDTKVSLGDINIYLDLLFLASCNEKQLDAFKEYPDWPSFKSRIELITVPYIRQFSVEKQIYDHQLQQERITKPVAPRTTEVLALWAVLTRLKKPDSEKYHKDVREIINRINPLEKALLLDSQTIPKWCNSKQAKELKKALPKLRKESQSYPFYEGRIGASARECQIILLNSIQNEKYKTLNPMVILEEINNLTQDRSLYPFLKQEVRDGYHDSKGFIKTVESWYLDTIDVEIRTSMGLFQESEQVRLFEKYIFHVTHWAKKEKFYDEITQKYLNADNNFMEEIEKIINPQKMSADDFRSNLISTIGAYSLENPDEKPDISKLFKSEIDLIEENDFKKRQKEVEKYRTNFAMYLANDGSYLDDESKKKVEEMLDTMINKFGYTKEGASEVISFYLHKRYDDESSSNNS